MSDLVAGATAAGHGLLVGCTGGGELTIGQLADILTIANANLADDRQMPRDWLPQGKRPSVHLGRAVAQVARNLYDVERVARRAGLDGQLPLWTARFLLVTKPAGADGRVGEHYPGRIVLEVELYEGDGTTPVLRFPNIAATTRWSAALEDDIRADFKDRIERTRLASADVTAWFNRTLHDRLGAVRYGANWYVPAPSKDRAIALYSSLMESGWGSSWIHPALPVATSKELSVGLAIALADEVSEITKRFVFARNEARREGRADIGPRAAANFAKEYNAVAAKADEWLHLLGPEGRDSTLAHVADALVEIDALLESAAAPTEPEGAMYADTDLGSAGREAP